MYLNILEVLNIHENANDTTPQSKIEIVPVKPTVLENFSQNLFHTR